MKTKHLFLLVLIAILGVGFCCCKQETPKLLLSEQQMIEIGTDMRLAEAYLGTAYPSGTPSDSLDAATKAIYGPILANYGISLAQYRKNMEYYFLKPQKMENIQKAISQSLRERATQAQEKTQKSSSVQK